MKEVIVIGGGVGGLTAALFSKWFGLETMVFNDSEKPSQLALATEIDNFPTYEKISGSEFLDKLKKQVENHGIEIKQDNVVGIKKESDKIIVYTNKGEEECKILIISSGAEHRKGGLPGEQEFLGKGVSYCATCDGPFFKGKDVVVWGGGDTALTYATYLQNINCKVTLVHRRKEFRGSEFNQEKAKEAGAKFVLGKTLKEIKGEKFVEKVILDDGSEIKCSAVFVAIGEVPSTAVFKQVGIEMNKSGFIIIRDRTQKTNIESIYAIGDATTTPLRQAIVTCGEAAVAAQEAYKKLRLEK